MRPGYVKFTVFGRWAPVWYNTRNSHWMKVMIGTYCVPQQMNPELILWSCYFCSSATDRLMDGLLQILVYTTSTLRSDKISSLCFCLHLFISLLTGTAHVGIVTSNQSATDAMYKGLACFFFGDNDAVNCSQRIPQWKRKPRKARKDITKFSAAVMFSPILRIILHFYTATFWQVLTPVTWIINTLRSSSSHVPSPIALMFFSTSDEVLNQDEPSPVTNP